ncbi:MAG TPA: putative DNA-binding domain-containing protein [Thermoanaerobaculia bacterium]|jgi:hypothetical protein
MSVRPPEHAPFTREAQRGFLDDLLGRRPRSSWQRRDAFRQPALSSVDERWHVYAHGFTARLTEALEAEYAAVCRIVGEAAFGRLVERYLGVFPPRSFDLAHAGDRLARFLEFDPLTRELGFLPDLARLERRIAEAFVAADARPLTWAELQARTPEEAASLPLALAPGTSLVRSDWPLDDLWRCRAESDDDAVDIPLEGRPRNVLVYRSGSFVRCEGVDETTARLIEAAGFGDATLDDLLALAAPGADPAAVGGLLAAFRELVRRDVFVIRRHTGSSGVIEIEGELP